MEESFLNNAARNKRRRAWISPAPPLSQPHDGVRRWSFYNNSPPVDCSLMNKSTHNAGCAASQADTFAAHFRLAGGVFLISCCAFKCHVPWRMRFFTRPPIRKRLAANVSRLRTSFDQPDSRRSITQTTKLGNWRTLSVRFSRNIISNLTYTPARKSCSLGSG